MKISPIIETDYLEDPLNYYTFGNYFSDEEINKIIEIGESLDKEEARIGKNELVKKYRDSNIAWMEYSDNTKFIYDKIEQAIIEANNALYKMILSHIEDKIQYTIYSSKSNQHYNWHLDYGGGNASKRKITCVVQLTGPDDYSGGDFLIKTGSNVTFLPKEKGTCIVFPSFILHKVCPVRTGTSKSIVLWSGGTHFM